MSLLNYIRLPYSEDKIAGILFLVTVLVPLYLVLPLPDPLELPKLVVWLLGVGAAVITLVYYQQQVSTVFTKLAIVSLGLMIAWSILATVFSLDVINSFIGVNIRLTNSVLFFLLWGLWLGLLSIQSKEKFYWLIRTTVVVGGIVALWGIIQSFGFAFYEVNPTARSLAPSFLGNPNFTSMFLVATSFLAVWTMVDTKTSKLRIFYGAVLGLSVWGTILFASRGAILGVLTGLLIATLGFALVKKWKLVGAMLIVGLALFTLSSVYTAASRPADAEGLRSLSDTTTVERFMVWDFTTEYIASNPWFGTGPANFFLAYRSNEHSGLSSLGWFDDAHNLSLHLAAGMGLPGLIFFLALVFGIAWQGYRVIRTKPDDSLLAIMLMAALGGWMVAASFNPVSIPNWLLLGLLLIGILQLRDQRTSFAINKFIRWPILIIGVVFILIGSCLFVSDVLVWRGNSAMAANDLDKAEQMLNLALYFNPTNINALDSQIKTEFAKQDFEQVNETAEYYRKLHPRSAGSLQKVMASYYFLYKQTQQPEYLQAFYDIADAYKDSNANNTQTYQDLSFAYIGVGDYEKAIQSAQKNVVLNSKSPLSWILLSRAYQLSDNYEGTVFALEKAYYLQPSHLMGAALHRAKNDVKTAREILIPINFPDLRI